MSNLEEPMGNIELRLTLAGIQEEIGDVKSIALDTKAQATKTNGKVMWHTKTIWLCMGALPLLTIWAGWLTNVLISQPNPPSTQEIQAAVQSALTASFNKEYNVTK